MEIKYEVKDLERVVLEDFQKRHTIPEGMDVKVNSGYSSVTIFVTEKKEIEPKGE